MPVTINGNGSISGLSVGGLPNGTVDADTLASNAVTSSKISDLFSSGAITIGGIRIQTGSVTTDSTASSTSTSYGVSTHQYRSQTVTGLSGFASAPRVWASLASDYHEANIGTIRDVTTSEFKVMYSASRDAGITSRQLSWLAIGEAS